MDTKQQYLKQYDKLMVLKNYSTATRKLYMNAVQQFWRWCDVQTAQQPSFDKSQALLLYLSGQMQSKAYTTVNGHYSALKLFYVSILGRTWNMTKLPRPRL